MSVSLNNADDDEYAAHWEQLKVALDTVLLNVPGSYQPISYEQVSGYFLRFSIRMSTWGLLLSIADVQCRLQMCL